MGNPSCLLYLVDVASSKRYLVDSGSAFSIVPHKSSAEPTRPRLMTADSKPLRAGQAHQGGCRDWSGGSAPAASGGLICTILSHSGSTYLYTFTQQPLPREARGQLAPGSG